MSESARRLRIRDQQDGWEVCDGGSGAVLAVVAHGGTLTLVPGVGLDAQDHITLGLIARRLMHDHHGQYGDELPAWSESDLRALLCRGGLASETQHGLGMNCHACCGEDGLGQVEVGEILEWLDMVKRAHHLRGLTADDLPEGDLLGQQVREFLGDNQRERSV